VMMTLGGLPGWPGGFSQTLILHWCIRSVEDAANGRAVRGPRGRGMRLRAGWRTRAGGAAEGARFWL
jgi:hypothetical protein